MRTLDPFHFAPAVIAPAKSTGACHILVAGGRVLCGQGQPWRPLDDDDLPLRYLDSVSQHYLGALQQRPCFVTELAPTDIPDGFRWLSLRSLMGRIDDGLFELIGAALQIVEWHHQHRFCGRCGGSTAAHPRERAKVCDACDHSYYPRLSPCVITVITREDHCLLAHGANFPEGFYSALAGFVEVGESLEGALHREVAEEVGVSLGALRYFGSQPWPFPGQLMIGFHAEYAAGDICVDGEEILDAQWWRYDQLPPVPPTSTLSGQLITEFVARFKTGEY